MWIPAPGARPERAVLLLDGRGVDRASAARKQSPPRPMRRSSKRFAYTAR